MSFLLKFLTKNASPLKNVHTFDAKKTFSEENIICINYNILRSRNVMDGYEFLLGLDRPTWLIAATVNE